MIKYILKRVLWMIPVLVGVIVLIFSLLYFTKADPAVMILGSDATQEELYEWRENYGLNDSYVTRLTRYFKELIIDHDLGKSYRTGQSVSAEIWKRFQVTAKLASICVIFEVVVGVSLGILAATHQNSILDKGSMVLSLLGASIPGFAVAVLLSWLFALKLHLLPSSGWGSIKYMILPILSNTLSGCGGLARQSRSSVLEVIRADYITTARAKGLSRGKIVFKHELKSALIPIITVVGTGFGRALGGTVVMEQVFTIPGLGNYMVQALNLRDYPVVLGSVLFMALVFGVVMLVVDILYALVDPRVRNRFA